MFSSSVLRRQGNLSRAVIGISSGRPYTSHIEEKLLVKQPPYWSGRMADTYSADRF